MIDMNRRAQERQRMFYALPEEPGENPDKAKGAN
jgi:hypothetical protein